MFNPYSTFTSIRNTAHTLKEFNLASFWNLSQKIQLFPGVKLINKIRADGLLREYISHDKNSVYSYTFRNEAVGRLSDYLIELNNNDIVINDNAIPRHIQGSLKRFSYSLKNLPDIMKILEDANTGVQAQVAEINALNLAYFLDISTAFEKNEALPAIEKRTVDYLCESDRLVTALDDDYNAVLGKIDLELDAVEANTACV
jgi:hypothetical protein